MITYVKGDVVAALKNGEIDVLVHGVNCKGKMNSGIAKQIREEFPKVFEEYKFYVYANTPFSYEGEDLSADLLGNTQTARVDKFKFIVNAFTQDDCGYDGKMFCSYDAINTCMKRIKEDATGNVKIGMPKIGAGLGGGDWKVIEAIINSVFHDKEVFVYELE